MIRPLNIAILGKTAAWEMVMQQLGLCAGFIDALPQEPLTKWAMIIANRPLLKDEKATLQQYAEDGGIFVSTTAAEPRFSIGNGQKSTTVLVNDSASPFELLLDFAAWQPKLPLSMEGAYRKTGRGIQATWEIDLDRQLINASSCRRSFYHPSEKNPNEIVAKSSKANILRLLFDFMKELFRVADLPFAHLAFQPDPLRGNFLFRIDSDYGTADQVERYYRLADIHNIAITWFLHVQAHEQWLAKFATMDHQEFAVHGYRHHNFRHFNDNLQNVEKAKSLMKAAGLQPQGYASPYGRWSPDIQRMIEQMSFAYSSEFSLDYDNLPFFPLTGDLPSPVLQIPIHPICIGSFRRTTANDAEIVDYFRFRQREFLYWHQPVIFYDHLLHDKYEVVDRIFLEANELGLKSIPFAEYTDWWRRRIVARPEVSWDEAPGVIRSSNHQIPLLIHLQNASSAIIATAGEHKIKQLPHYTRSAPQYEDTLRHLRKFNWKLWHYNYLDWKWRRKS